MELKSSDEKLARETISESGVGEPENPIYRDFSTVDAKSEEKEQYFWDYCVPRSGTLRKDNKRTTGMQKASMRTAGAKRCYAFVIVRIKTIDIAAEEETSARQFQEDRAWRRSERDREKTVVRIYMHIDLILKTIMLILQLPFDSVNLRLNRLITIEKCMREGCVCSTTFFTIFVGFR